VSYFAFIVNRNWLLWYFRLPGIRAGIFDFDELKAFFPSLELSVRSDPSKSEGMLRLASRSDSEAVLQFVNTKMVLVEQLQADVAQKLARSRTFDSP